MKAKLCGMKTLAAATAAQDAGADFIGFIFYKKSHRYIMPEQAKEIAAKLKNIKKVGVFVDAPLDEVNTIADMVDLDYIQLHGRETTDYATKCNRPIIKAFRYGDGFSYELANNFPAEIILIDAYKEGAAGGTGINFNWQQAKDDIAKVNKPVLIAGGITRKNLAAVKNIFNPYGVDVSGSLEINKEKSIKKINEFMQRVRELNEGYIS